MIGPSPDPGQALSSLLLFEKAVATSCLTIGSGHLPLSATGSVQRRTNTSAYVRCFARQSRWTNRIGAAAAMEVAATRESGIRLDLQTS